MNEPTPTRFAKSQDGDQIAYRTLGQGGTPIILFQHRSCVDLQWDDPVFRYFMDRLAEAGQVITFDWRGSGASDALPGGGLPTVEAWSHDARVVLDAVGVVRAFILVSGIVTPLALVFAATHPERTAGLVVIDGWARIAWDEDYTFGVPTETIDPLIDGLVEAHRSNASAANDVPSRASDPTFQEFIGRLQRLAIPPASSAQLTKWAIRLDVRDTLPVLACPTLVVQSAHHPYISGRVGEYLAEHIAGARFATRNGAANFLYSPEDSEEIAALVHEFLTGAPLSFDRERSLATVLFTDIVDSTLQASRLGDRAWIELLEGHDAVVDREVRRFRGRKVNPTGDGMVAVFDGPARAVRCAQAITAGVRPLGLTVRAGLHTGEIEHRGSDVGGIAVHVASRISSLAQGGEVLVSRTVTDLALGSGLGFDSRGDHDLKGVPGTWTLYAVTSARPSR